MLAFVLSHTSNSTPCIIDSAFRASRQLATRETVFISHSIRVSLLCLELHVHRRESKQDGESGSAVQRMKLRCILLSERSLRIVESLNILLTSAVAAVVVRLFRKTKVIYRPKKMSIFPRFIHRCCTQTFEWCLSPLLRMNSHYSMCAYSISLMCPVCSTIILMHHHSDSQVSLISELLFTIIRDWRLDLRVRITTNYNVRAHLRFEKQTEHMNMSPEIFQNKICAQEYSRRNWLNAS